MKKGLTIITSTITFVSLLCIGIILGIKNTPGAYDYLPESVQQIPFVKHSFDGSISGKQVRKIIKETDTETAIFLHTLNMGTHEEGTAGKQMDLLFKKHPGWAEGTYSQIWSVSGFSVPTITGEESNSFITFVNYRAMLSTSGSFSFDETGLVFNESFARGQDKNGKDGLGSVYYNNEISGISDKTSPEFVDKSARFIVTDMLNNDGEKIGLIIYEIIY